MLIVAVLIFCEYLHEYVRYNQKLRFNIFYQGHKNRIILKSLFGLGFLGFGQLTEAMEEVKYEWLKKLMLKLPYLTRFLTFSGFLCENVFLCSTLN